ncbi:phage tail protein [Planococcus beigongshangi]|uniref:phage tail protein n=1 Tax=Planococcus beigongshangi TaxID=2782536 RepID=UPI00193B1357
MLTVTYKNQTEAINTYNILEMDEEVNGTFTVSFTSFFHENNPGHDLIEEEAIITANGYDFRVMQLTESPKKKRVTALSTFYDLIGHRQEEIYGGTRRFDQFANFVFSGTDWTYTSDINESVLIPNYGDGNVIKLVQNLCAAFECEFKILPGNRVHFSKQIGGDNDAQYRYGHNVKALSKNVDASNLRTWITGYGANGLKVTYVSPLADVYGTKNREAEPVRDERFTIPENLTKRIMRELQDYPDISFELDAIELSDKELGERVWLIYEIMKMKFQTRVIAKKSTIRNGKWITKSVTLGNSKPKKLQDILTEQNVKIDENAKQNNTRFEQTNEKISLVAEQIGGEVDQARAEWSVEATAIRGEVSHIRTYTDAELGKVREEASSNFNQLAGRINAKADYTQFTALGTRVNNVEWDLNAVEGVVSTKVSSTDYNGREIISLVSQTSSLYKIQAKNIEFRGAVTVLSELSDDLGTIRAGNINISNDIRVGNGIYLGNQASTQAKSLYFFNTANITAYNYGAATAINFNADEFKLAGFRLEAPSISYVNAPKLVQSVGPVATKIELAYSPSSNRIYFDIEGVRKGSVVLT